MTPKGDKTVAEKTLLRVRLTPKGGRNALSSYTDGVLHARVAAPPVDGAANKALIALLSEALRLPKSAIHFHSGETGREKILYLEGIDAQTLEDRIVAKLS